MGSDSLAFRIPSRAIPVATARDSRPKDRAARPVRVLLVEDHALVRAGMLALLETMDHVTVVGQAADGVEALSLIATVQPDVVLLDISMPNQDGYSVLARIVPDHPDVRILVVSMHDGEEYVWEALHAGAHGYLLKNSSPTEFALALRAVAGGDAYLSPGVSRWIVSDYVDRGPDGRGAKTGNRLSPRQVQIVRLIASGRTNREIAYDLSIGVKTVETHRAELMTRLDIHDVPGLVRYAIRTGLVQADS